MAVGYVIVGRAANQQFTMGAILPDDSSSKRGIPMQESLIAAEGRHPLREPGGKLKINEIVFNSINAWLMSQHDDQSTVSGGLTSFPL